MRELDQDNILRIFSKNFRFPIVDTVLGRAVKMDPLSAFLFSNVTGAGYLDNITYPFTPKGALRILREALQYHFVTGIFDKAQLFYSPVLLHKNKPYLFTNDKYVLFLEGLSEKDFKDKLAGFRERLEQATLTPTDFIVLRVEKWKKGYGMECLLEYFACEYFKPKGYIVENQTPLVHTVGTPDFAAFKLAEKCQGFHLVELAMLRFTHHLHLLDNLSVQHIIVGEAKTATTQMRSQLEKYLDTGLFRQGYEMHPAKQLPSADHLGLLTIDDEDNIKVQPPHSEYTVSDGNRLPDEEYHLWYQNNLKFYLIANLTNQELEQWVNGKKPAGKYTQQKIIDVVVRSSLDEIINTIKEYM